MTVPRKKLLTVGEYYAMARAAALGNAKRVELIEGEIVRMADSGSRHQVIVDRLKDRRSSPWFGACPLPTGSWGPFPPHPSCSRHSSRDHHLGLLLVPSWHTVVRVAHDDETATRLGPPPAPDTHKQIFKERNRLDSGNRGRRGVVFHGNPRSSS